MLLRECKVLCNVNFKRNSFIIDCYKVLTLQTASKNANSSQNHFTENCTISKRASTTQILMQECININLAPTLFYKMYPDILTFSTVVYLRYILYIFIYIILYIIHCYQFLLWDS